MHRKPGPMQSVLLSALSWYSKNMPIQPGKSPLQQLVLRVFGSIELMARSQYGDTFLLHFPEDHGWEDLYFRGTFETGTSELIRKVLRPGDVALDIGANLGWYTVLIAKAVGLGRCHAFEPLPELFQRLKANCEANHLEGTVELNEVALGEREGTAELYTFQNLGAGSTSLSKLGRNDYSAVSVPIVTLDSYLRARQIPRVDFIKIDVEGAEMSVLKGAGVVLRARRSPVWLIEMNVETSKSFGYAPEDLLEFLLQRNTYRFYRVVLGWGETLLMKSPRDYRHGDNVLCVPGGQEERVKDIT
jgi:FkbM family methyltransferase